MSEPELYRRHRPKTLAEVVGQPEAVRFLTDGLKNGGVPHAILFEGPSGTGKTTLARILRKELGCVKADYVEVDCPSLDGVLGEVRAIQQRRNLAPVGGGKARVWFFEEVQSLSRAGFAQQALLKMLEDVPPHCYFFLATTDPEKLHRAVRGRCTRIKLAPLAQDTLQGLIKTILKRENTSHFTPEVIARIAEAADGSAREALVLLGQVIGIKDETEQINVIENKDLKKKAYDLVRALLWEKADPRKVAQIITDLGEEQDWEGLRYMVLKNAGNEVLKCGRNSARALRVISAFESDWFNSKRYGLIRSCFEVLGPGN